MTLNEREPVRPDVLVEVPADESTARFTAVTDEGRDSLASLMEKLKTEGEPTTWDGRSGRVAMAGNSADYVYQTCLLDGLVVMFPDGNSISIPRQEIARIFEAIEWRH